ncbi:multiubiquitin domain-containing protein [Mycolicibacterium celeriflavum]|uniref:multiubiquitin domain-containing protein n=1 Tax=Mycolicibacterium celeriflavum TaxID=1249101 RepID=UPI003CEC15F7
MSEVTIETEAHRRGQPVEVQVNNRPVRLPDHKVTGLEIKQAAIEQGVHIELDFVLSELRKNHPAQVVGDTDTVTVTKNSRFTAVAGDDNS